MKIKLLLLILVAVLVTSNVYSQGRMSHEDRMKILSEKLSLTNEQYTQIDSILIEQSKEFQKFRGESSGNREEMREKFTELRKKTDEKILEVLNEVQMEKYNKYIEERWQNRRVRQEKVK